MPELGIMTLTSVLMYAAYYLFFYSIDKTDIEPHKKKVRLNKYTNKLFFMWKRNEKIYWFVYIMIIVESVLFVLVWILYIFKIVHIFKIVSDIYIYTYAYGITFLGLKVFIKRVKDFINGKLK